MSLVIDQRGPVPEKKVAQALATIEAREAKKKADEAYQAKIEKFSNENLAGEIRKQIKGKFVSGLDFAIGAVLLCALRAHGVKGAGLDHGPDPYRLQTRIVKKQKAGRIVRLDIEDEPKPEVPKS